MGRNIFRIGNHSSTRSFIAFEMTKCVEGDQIVPRNRFEFVNMSKDNWSNLFPAQNSHSVAFGTKSKMIVKLFQSHQIFPENFKAQPNRSWFIGFGSPE